MVKDLSKTLSLEMQIKQISKEKELELVYLATKDAINYNP